MEKMWAGRSSGKLDRAADDFECVHITSVHVRCVSSRYGFRTGVIRFVSEWYSAFL